MSSTKDTLKTKEWRWTQKAFVYDTNPFFCEAYFLVDSILNREGIFEWRLNKSLDTITSHYFSKTERIQNRTKSPSFDINITFHIRNGCCSGFPKFQWKLRWPCKGQVIWWTPFVWLEQSKCLSKTQNTTLLCLRLFMISFCLKIVDYTTTTICINITIPTDVSM